jgi:hypothetical protein
MTKVGIWEWRKWRMRWGRFRGLDKDTRERTQRIPDPEPPIELQTHHEKFKDLERKASFLKAGDDNDSE